MFILKQLSKIEYLKLAKQHQRVLVTIEIAGDTLTPVGVYHTLQDELSTATLLETSPKESKFGRYSFLGFAPFAEFKTQGNSVTIDEKGKSIVSQEAPFVALRRFYARNKIVSACEKVGVLGFMGGMVGYIAYDAVRQIEPILSKHKFQATVPDIHFKCYQYGIIFDHQTSKVILASVANTAESSLAPYEQAIAGLKALQAKLYQVKPQPVSFAAATVLTQNSDYAQNVASDADDNTFKQMVEQAKQHIRAGDIFQVVPSRCFQQSFKSSPFSLYRALRLLSPAPYMFYLNNGKDALVGASPEKLVSVKDNIVESCPLAGTRPRGETPQEDDAIARELLSNEKETAEHMMLVDLARNDIGKVAKPNGVTVTALKQVQRFSHVMHLSSNVQGALAADKDAIDALCACFPAGTLSGAPKIRAMSIIDSLEHSARGVYGGAIVSLDNVGNLDSAIAIRMAHIRDEVAYIRTGAGIVFDSEANAEALETHHKARNVLAALKLVVSGASS